MVFENCLLYMESVNLDEFPHSRHFSVTRSPSGFPSTSHTSDPFHQTSYPGQQLFADFFFPIELFIAISFHYISERILNLRSTLLAHSKKLIDWLIESRVGGGAEGEGEKPKQSALSTEPEVGLDLMTLRSWPELKSRVGHSTSWATQTTPRISILFHWSVCLSLMPISHHLDYYSSKASLEVR